MPDNEIAEKRAEHGRAIITRVRELEAEDKAHGEAFAATVASPNKRFKLRREPAAALVSMAINAPYSRELLRRSDCPFIVVSRIALYAEEDLRQLATEILDASPLRHGAPGKRDRKKKSAGTA
jgi:hypothetical protein